MLRGTWRAFRSWSLRAHPSSLQIQQPARTSPRRGRQPRGQRQCLPIYSLQIRAAHQYASSQQQQRQQQQIKVPDTAPPQQSSAAERVGQAGRLPRTVQDMEPIIAANCPVFYFHPEERYFPCGVQWFLARCELTLVRKGWRRRVARILEAVGALDSSRLAAAQTWYDMQRQEEPTLARTHFMLLRLVDPAHRVGQPERLNQIPVYVHVKEVVDPSSRRRTALEVNYMKFLAYNGSYKLFGFIPAGDLGAHDADWEHVTLRLSPDGSSVYGLYYSAHRHCDGVWRSADGVPRGAAGRPVAHVAVNGHGSYPEAGTIPRIFFAANDQTSTAGAVWDPECCVVVTNAGRGGQLPSVEDRGSTLNGTSYAALSPKNAAPQKGSRARQPRVEREPSPWLEYAGRWGSTVEAPAQQEWFARAENPVSRSWLAQVFFPLAPGIETIYEPAMEEVSEMIGTAKGKLEHMEIDVSTAASRANRKVLGWLPWRR